MLSRTGYAKRPCPSWRAMTAGLLRVFQFIFNYHRRRLSKRGEPNVATRLRRTSEEALPRRTVEQGFLPVCTAIQLASPRAVETRRNPAPWEGRAGLLAL